MKSLVPRESSSFPQVQGDRPKSTPRMALARRAHVSRHIRHRLPYYLIPDEAHQLIEATDNERHRLFLRTMWETGARVSEAIRITLADVSRDGIRVLGKGGVERVIFVQDGLVTAVLFYARDTGLDRNDYLLPSRKRGPITKQRADQMIKRLADRAGLQRNVHAHLFRYGYAINFLNCEGRLDALQEQLGYRDLNTTRIYLRLPHEDVRRELSKIQF